MMGLDREGETFSMGYFVCRFGLTRLLGISNG